MTEVTIKPASPFVRGFARAVLRIFCLFGVHSPSFQKHDGHPLPYWRCDTCKRQTSVGFGVD